MTDPDLAWIDGVLIVPNTSAPTATDAAADIFSDDGEPAADASGDDYSDLFPDDDEPGPAPGGDGGDESKLDLDDDPAEDADATDGDPGEATVVDDWRIEAPCIEAGMRWLAKHFRYPPLARVETPDGVWLAFGCGTSTRTGARSYINARIGDELATHIEADATAVRVTDTGLDVTIKAIHYPRNKIARYWVHRDHGDVARLDRYIALTARGLVPLSFQKYCRVVETLKERRRRSA